ncbi:TRAP transporter small permease [Ruegeria sp. SCP11]|uniref:TRAP transporter small permease n=1 Tax=Ruegeria sp. SCP11 TaxID=3141378 RepID=UPI0033357FEB
MTFVKSLMNQIERVLAAACVLAFAIMLGLGVLTVLFRFVIQSSLAFPDEMIRYLFVWLIAIGSAIGLRRNIHAAIGILVKAMPDGLKRAALVFASVVTVVFLAILIETGLASTISALSQISPAMQISMAWVFAAVPVGALFGLLFTVETLVSQLTLPVSELAVDDH